MEDSAPEVARWIRLAREGLPGALDRLLEAHRDLLRLTAAACLRGTSRRPAGSALGEAALVDEALRTARARFRSFRGATEDEWVSWLRRIVLEGAGPPAATDADVSRQARELADALALLDPDGLEIVVLRHVEGLGWPEIAERTGRPPDEARRLWTQALRRVGENLGGRP